MTCTCALIDYPAVAPWDRCDSCHNAGLAAQRAAESTDALADSLERLSYVLDQLGADRSQGQAAPSVQRRERPVPGSPGSGLTAF